MKGFTLLILLGLKAFFILATFISLHYNIIKKIELSWLLLKLDNSTSENWRKLVLMNTLNVNGSYQITAFLGI